MVSKIFLVILIAHEFGQLVGISQAEFDKPATPFGVFVHGRGGSFEGLIDRDDFAARWRVDLARRFNRLDHRGLLALAELGAYFGELDKDDISQLRLGVGSNADHGDIAVEFDPLVVPR